MSELKTDYGFWRISVEKGDKVHAGDLSDAFEVIVERLAKIEASVFADKTDTEAQMARRFSPPVSDPLCEQEP